jgi:hypothetical protein
MLLGCGTGRSADGEGVVAAVKVKKAIVAKSKTQTATTSLFGCLLFISTPFQDLRLLNPNVLNVVGRLNMNYVGHSPINM